MGDKFENARGREDGDPEDAATVANGEAGAAGEAGANEEAGAAGDVARESGAEAAGSERRVADSISSAAGATGYSERLIQTAKSLGCEAFRGSRVYLDELEEYILENNLEALEKAFQEEDEISVDIKRERLRKIRFANDVEEGKYVAKAQIGERISEIGTDLKRRLRMALEDDLPQRIQGKPAQEIRARMKDVVDDLCNQFSRHTKEWTR